MCRLSGPPCYLVDVQNQEGTEGPKGPQSACPAAGGSGGGEPTLCVLSSEGPGLGLPGRLPGPRSGKDCSQSSESSFLRLPVRLPPARRRQAALFWGVSLPPVGFTVLTSLSPK